METIHINLTGTKEDRYKELFPQLTALLEGENDLIANLANIAAVLKSGLGFFWVGFYIGKEGELVLGPFQGTVACTRIPYGKGVCGTAYIQQKTILVPDVDQFPGHIACSSQSRSEIVVPVRSGEDVYMVLDVDSDKPNDFDHTDQVYLERICALIAEKVASGSWE